MNPAPAPAARLATGGTTELCHLTVAGPDRRADLAIPATATLGELLPIVVKHTAGDGASDGAWVLQRLGGPPLDFGGTPESLDLREGEVLYLVPETAPLPEFDFDDVSVGVAHSVAARADQWRPQFSRVLMLGAAVVVAAAYAVGLSGVKPASTQALCYGLAALLLAVGAVVDSRMAEDKLLGTAAGLGACAFAGLVGFSARHSASGLFVIDRRALMIVGFGVAAVALLVASLGRLSVAVFGTVTGTALCAAIGAALANAFAVSAVTIVAIIAAVLYAATSVNLRIALRVARLRVALLPRTAEELQQDIDPVPEADVTARTGRAVAQLNALFVTCSLVYVTAFVQLAVQSGWAGKTLAAVFSITVLLRSRALTLAWQRAPLALSGTAGLCLVTVTIARTLGSGGRVWTLILLLAAATALLAAARRLPGRRLLPIWGQLADTAELWTSIALIPLLLQLLHVYARFRALIS